MLVLSRKLNEQIRIDDRVTVTVLRVKGNSVRLGIDAPKDVRVVRGELPPLDDGTHKQAPLSRKLPRLAKLDESPVPKDDADRRQRAAAAPNHPERWTVASMRDRTRTVSESRESTRSSSRRRDQMNPVLG